MKKITLSQNLLMLLFLLLGIAGSAQTQTDVFDYTGTTQTFTVPTGVTSITVECWGGGGHGGARTSGGAGCGGGSGGGYSKSTIAVTPGNTVSIAVGQGSPASTGNSPGGATTAVYGATTVAANGGLSVNYNTYTGAAAPALGTGTVRYVGGAGETGTLINSGGGGSSAQAAGNGADGSGTSGGTVGGGGNGGDGTTSNHSGYDGAVPGGGGGGGRRSSGSTKYGGAGGDGQVWITYTLNPEINVKGNGNNIADGSTTTSTTTNTDFGSVSVASGTSVKSFVIQNLGTTNLTIGAITFTGTAAADYSVTTAPAATVAPGSSTTFNVTFDPSAGGTRSATIHIASNDVDENPYDFNLTGIGTAPEIDIKGNAVGIVSGDTTPSSSDDTDFGTANVSGGTIVHTFTIYNTGNQNLTLGTISLTGGNAADFSITGAPATTIAAGGSTTISITFDPSASGTRYTTLSIANNDSNENPYTFKIQGAGGAPEIDVLGNGISITSGDNSPSVSDATDFGTVSIDAGQTLVTYIIKNTGTSNLLLGAITFSGPNPGDFSVNTYPSATVAPGGQTTMIIAFSPSVIGTRNAWLSMVNDDANENPYKFYMQGLGVQTYADTDGDGITDNNDIDDDNDGITDVLEETECRQSSVSGTTTYTFLNETFGTGTTKGLININIPGATCSYCYEDGIVGPDTVDCPSQSSWILDDGEYVVVYKIAGTSASDPENIHGNLAWNGLEDHTPGDTNGRMAVFNASYTPGTFYETTINGIIPNTPITYSFWVLNIMSQAYYSGTILPNITVEFLDMSDNVLSTFNTGDIGRCNGGTGVNTCAYSEWQQYTTSVNLGTVTNFKIRFKNNAPGGGGNDLAIDDIVLTQEYCDRDGDGIANIFDLDSDNDGIPDIEEAGYKAMSSGKATMDRTLGSWADANHNGMADSIDAQIAGGTYSIPDTDVDGTKDFQDLDSDNDAIFDVDEANLLNGDGDINGDGFGDGPDTDKDGILDLFDTSASFGTNARAYANDTDGNGTPDYRQLDSDSDGVKDITGTLYASLDGNNDGKIDGTTDVEKDGILDSFDTNTAVLGSPRNLNRKLFLDFDGRNDYGEGPQLTSGLAQSTIMCWIKLTAPFTSTGYIIGQDNFKLLVDMSSGVPKLYAIAKGGAGASCSTPLDTNRWYHVCAVFDGSDATQKLRLYVNGKLENFNNSGVLAGALTASTVPFTFGRYPGASANYFKGSIDEVRVFNMALTADQIQKMVYQEIQQAGASIRGAVVPKNIESTIWFSLLGYWRMDAYKDDVIDNYVIPGTDDNTTANKTKIYNHKVIKGQLAPMPFLTTQPGAVDAAVSQNNFVNGNDLFLYDWSIIKIQHNIDLPYNMSTLGLFVNSGINFNMTNDNQIKNTWYMKLDGKIDLQGKSQLVQTATSDLDPASAGKIERDQQGTTNKFNYNYWSSPVGAISSGTNNNPFTVAGVMKDGTDPLNPQNIQWTSGLNGSPTSPITLSSYWIFKFQNVTNAYANWATVGPNGSLTTGQGFTLKGSGAATPTQNYTFIGKPNNGNVTIPIAANNLNLCGNPYPSAIDANQFITDNLGSLTGTLYFWEHFSTNASHILANYQGGYATRTLVGGTPPVSPSEVSGLGSSTRIPSRYIPVGQGFFVVANTLGGNIAFTNGQRGFVKENDANSNFMFRMGTTQPASSFLNNNSDVYEQDTHAKIRLGFDSYNNFHRQVLLGFMDELAGPGIDPGYDGTHIDSQPNDMYFVNGTALLNIQADGYFNTALVYPIGVKTDQAGPARFLIDGKENFDETQPIYIYDAETGIYHDITSQPFSIDLPAGTNNTRFSLRFSNPSALGTQQQELAAGMFASYAPVSSVLTIKNNTPEAVIETVYLYDMLGQSLVQWKVADQDQHNIQLPVRNLATGTYIVKMVTSKGDVSKKIIVN